MAAKKGANGKPAREIIEQEVCKIWQKHGIKAAEEQLRQAIAAGWPRISLELFDLHRQKLPEEPLSHPAKKLHGAAAAQQEEPVPEGVEPEVTPAIWANMLIHRGNAPTVWEQFPIAARKAAEWAPENREESWDSLEELLAG